jgi:single-stranded DNA-binding protein
MIDCAFYAVVGRDPERKTSKNGRTYLRLNVRAGNGDAAVWVSVMAFNDVDELAERLKKDSKVYIEGTITADAWIDRDGKARPNLNVMTWHCVETHRIGRNKPKRERKVAASRPASGQQHEFHSDPIGF